MGPVRSGQYGQDPYGAGSPCRTRRIRLARSLGEAATRPAAHSTSMAMTRMAPRTLTSPIPAGRRPTSGPGSARPAIRRQRSSTGARLRPVPTTATAASAPMAIPGRSGGRMAGMATRGRSGGRIAACMATRGRSGGRIRLVRTRRHRLVRARDSGSFGRPGIYFRSRPHWPWSGPPAVAWPTALRLRWLRAVALRSDGARGLGRRRRPRGFRR